MRLRRGIRWGAVRAIFVVLSIALPQGAGAKEISAASSSVESVEAMGSSVGFCQHVEGVATSESALLLSPELFVSAGLVRAGSAVTGDEATAIPTSWRLTAGAQLSVSRMLQGSLLLQRAEAQCRKYRAEEGLEFSLRQADEVARSRSRIARTIVLRDALPRAEAILESTRARVREGRATVADLDVVALKVDTLRSLASEPIREMGMEMEGEIAPVSSMGEFSKEARSREEFSKEAPSKEAPAVHHLGIHGEADDEIERIEGGLRGLRSWDVVLRGGYDRVNSTDTETALPLFGMVTLSFNLGVAWQPSANALAAKGRRSFRAARLGGPEQRYRETARELRATWDETRKRSRELSLLLQDLEARLDEAEGLGGEVARKYAEHLWFDVVKVRADHAYVRARLEALDRLLSSDGEYAR